ncbi:HD-GYP domain-containing protein [Roseateles sp. DB2]|uniref:HD-GYP domain-containing protein n=1 Tax=Roseateles sp. DB2 TaxID=3453717 RepID=UPI003EEC8132
MELVPLPPHSLRIGQVLTFSVRDAEGHLLFAAGQTLQNTPQVQALIQRGAWVLAHETKEYQKALVHKMDTLMMQGASLASIVKVEADYRVERPQRTVAELSEPVFWTDLHLRAHSLLKDPREDFLGRLETLREEALQRFRQRPDAVLTLLVHDASQDFQRYSARHAVLCLLVADLVARQLGWAEEGSRALHNAALTMNLSTTLLQDRLAAQEDKPSERQRVELREHGDRSAQLLRELGVHDELWLGAVRLHHEAGPGALAGRVAVDQLARVLRRIDIFGARLSPRRSRKALSGAAAVRAIYLDELQQPDEAGAAVIKAVGLYPPGSLVRLANGELGIVARRGHSATEPLVAALIGKSGAPLSGPVARDTRLQAQAVAASLAPHELKLVINMEKLLKTAS